MQRMGCDLLQGFHFGRPELVRPLLALEPGADDRKRA